MTQALSESQLKSVPLLFRGKVRDVYDLKDKLLIVTTDRISAFDYILPTPIPRKGEVLTKMSRYWMKKFESLISNHLVDFDLKSVLTAEEIHSLGDRSEVVVKAEPLPVELIVRGYLLGSGYQDYQKTGQVCGIDLPKNLKLAEKLPEPILTPSTKAPQGEHDENITFAQMVELVGQKLAEQAREACLKIYSEAAKLAESKGIIIADTKFELGLHEGKLILIDEVLTPDSSRFWPADAYQVGHNPPSYDKQFVRDYLLSTPWDRNSPPPELPAEIAQKTSEKYLEALNLLTKN